MQKTKTLSLHSTLCLLHSALILFSACEQVQMPVRRPVRREGPRINATVLTYRTTILPRNTGFVHRVVIADNKARLGDDGEPWRLFNFTDQTVTTVDDVEKTYRTVPFATLMRTRRNLVTKSLPFGVPAAELIATGVTRTFGEFEAEQFIVRVGAYKREIWLSTESIAPPSFFGMILASDSIGEPNAAMYRDVFPRLVQQTGFPVFDRTDMKMNGEDYVIEKKLVKVESTTVPADWLAIPAGYTEESAARESAAGRRPASSTQPDRRIPAME